MKQVEKQPEDGQWVELWEYMGEVWCATKKIEDGVLYEYDTFEDRFVELHFNSSALNKTFWVME